MKTVLVVGASGFLGRNLVSALNEEGHNIIAVARKTEKIPQGANVKRLSTDDFFAAQSISADIAVNCAFARGNKAAELVAALDFNEKLIEKLKSAGIASIINISSQGIYRNVNPGEFLGEDGEIEPKEMYALAKYAQEKLFTSNLGNKVTNIRLASLSANARFLVFFAESVTTGRNITVTAPRQYVSIIDVRDAVCGLQKVIRLDPTRRATVYNLGTGKQYSILELAEMTNEIGSRFGYEKVSVCVEDGGKEAAVGMDCSRLRKDTGWKPLVEINDMIESIYEGYISKT